MTGDSTHEFSRVIVWSFYDYDYDYDCDYDYDMTDYDYDYDYDSMPWCGQAQPGILTS